MRVNNIRLSWATNSSSTHYIIEAGGANGRPASDNEFGWGYNVQKSQDDKMRYFAQQLYTSLEDDSARDKICDELFKGLWDENGYIDHQSVMTIPSDFNNKPCLEFFSDLSAWIAQDDSVHIEITNDNRQEDGRGKSHSKWGFVPMDIYPPHKLRCRKQGDGWLLFNDNTGAKVRFNFKGEDKSIDYVSDYPELIDVKITDYCDAGCSFCYQDSTPNGKHASLETIRSLAKSMHDAQVFEVALGGGEPTAHPNFAEILQIFADQNVVPNFTTRSTIWLSNKKILAAVVRHCGGIGFSVMSARDVGAAIEAVKGTSSIGQYQGPSLSFHYIMGLKPLEEFQSVLEAVKHHGTLLLLGYKKVGRALAQPYSAERWRKIVNRLEDKPRIAIDTALAKQCPNELEGIDRRMYQTEEGKQSMYIDAVENVFGSCSYIPRDNMKPLVKGVQKAWDILQGRTQPESVAVMMGPNKVGEITVQCNHQWVPKNFWVGDKRMGLEDVFCPNCKATMRIS